MRILFVLLVIIWLSGFLLATYVLEPSAITERSPMQIGVDIGQILSPFALLGVIFSFDQQRKQLETQRAAFSQQMAAMNRQSEALQDQASALLASVAAQDRQANFLERSALAQSEHTQAMLDSLKLQTAHTALAQTAQQVSLIDRRIDGFVRYAIQSADRAQLKSDIGSVALLGSAVSLVTSRENGPNFFSHALIDAMTAAKAALDRVGIVAWELREVQRCKSLMNNLRGMVESLQSFIDSASDDAKDAVKFERDHLRLATMTKSFAELEEKMDQLLRNPNIPLR